jgi:AcrR family transcriptional regulator
MEVAERMFADRGFASVSIRDLTAEAGVNIASINYYFGSKDKLLYEVFKRRVNEMTDERIARLREVQAKANGNPAPRDILRALLEPGIRWREMSAGRRAAIKFLVRARSEGTSQIKKVIDTRLGALPDFREALCKAMPETSFEDVCWGIHFALSTTHQVGLEFERLVALSDGQCDPSNTDALIERLLDFCVAGFVAGGQLQRLRKPDSPPKT